MLPWRISADKSTAYRKDAERHIEAQLQNYDLRQITQIHFETERPDLAIPKYVATHKVDLLVMGTIGRTGIPGLIVGNTAERLLPQIPCSVIAIKPDGFETPIQLGE